MKKRSVKRNEDMVIAQNVRAARLAQGLSQEQLGAALGLTFQQVQKYEKGVNRISAGTLVAIANALHVPVAQFFAGVNTPKAVLGLDPIRVLALDRQGIAVAKAFNSIPNDAARRAVIVLMESLGTV
jgi:transcriptional regulator with XRE-family HTH domain